MNQIEEIRAAVESVRGAYIRNQKHEPYRSDARRWDTIIQLLCAGCGKPFEAFDGKNRQFYCHQCRQILYPEDEPREKKRY